MAMHPETMGYLKPTDDQLEHMNVLRVCYTRLMEDIEQHVPDGRYKDLAITALEASAMLANKGITRLDDGTPRT